MNINQWKPILGLGIFSLALCPMFLTVQFPVDYRMKYYRWDVGTLPWKMHKKHNSSIKPLPTITPTIHMITPTYASQAQNAHLTRLAQTLSLVPFLHWVVVEDSQNTSSWIEHLARDKGVNLTLLAVHNSSGTGHGSHQRNLALDLIKREAPGRDLIYFGDDDNSYDTRLFDAIRTTKTISLVPVGNFNGPGLSAPVVINGTIVGIADSWLGGRKFPIDMAAITINVEFWIRKGSPKLSTQVGLIETKFLQDINVKLEDIEPKAENATKIFVWHTQTKQKEANATSFSLWQQKFPYSNLRALKLQIQF